MATIYSSSPPTTLKGAMAELSLFNHIEQTAPSLLSSLANICSTSSQMRHAISLTNNLYITDFAGLAGVPELSNQHNHWFPPSVPQQDWQVQDDLLGAAHLVLQDNTAENMKDHFL